MRNQRLYRATREASTDAHNLVVREPVYAAGDDAVLPVARARPHATPGTRSAKAAAAASALVEFPLV